MPIVVAHMTVYIIVHVATRSTAASVARNGEATKVPTGTGTGIIPTGTISILELPTMMLILKIPASA